MKTYIKESKPVTLSTSGLNIISFSSRLYLSLEYVFSSEIQTFWSRHFVPRHRSALLYLDVNFTPDKWLTWRPIRPAEAIWPELSSYYPFIKAFANHGNYLVNTLLYKTLAVILFMAIRKSIQSFPPTPYLDGLISRRLKVAG